MQTAVWRGIAIANEILYYITTLSFKSSLSPSGVSLVLLIGRTREKGKSQI